MDTTKIAESVLAWWVRLFKERGLDSRIGLNPLKVDTKIALMQENGVVYLKSEPRYYFFGFDLQSGEAVFYTFIIPKIGFQLKPETRDNFCGELEKTLNEPLSGDGIREFTKFFTPSVRVSFMSRYFQEEEYQGINIDTLPNSSCFKERNKRMRKRAWNSWRKNVFIPASVFIEENISRYASN